MRKIEVASYPKSGNTWMRYLLAGLFDLDVIHGIPDFHQKGIETLNSMQPVELSQKTGFYKSHIFDNKSIVPDCIIHIYRHPLDIFLSSLNFFNFRRNPKKFLYGEIKSVDKIYKDGQMDLYFEKFNYDLGLSFYRELLGEDAEYSKYIEKAFSSEKGVSIKYEKLLNNPDETFFGLIQELFPDDEIFIPTDLYEKVNSLTKFSNNPFYWKADMGNYKSYLRSEQIELFYCQHEPLLKKLGYIL